MSEPKASEEVGTIQSTDGTHTVPEHGWACFHCGEVCLTREDAVIHFGVSRWCDPICQVSRAQYRRMEELHQSHLQEDTELHREIYQMQAAHAVALRREEEKGYARGIRDAAANHGYGVAT